MIVHSSITALDGPAAVHVDRIVRDCLDRRDDRATTALRLLCASDLADVLERAS